MTSEQAFGSLAALELTDDEVRSVLARYARPRRSRALAPGLAFAAALVIAVAVPPSRAEMADALRAVLHGGSLPGRAIPTAQLPEWLRQIRFAEDGQPRVVAEADGEQMLVYRQASGTLCFEFGDVGICDWTEEDLFADQPVALFGPTLQGESDHFRLWGLTLASVAHVELTFADGPPVRVRSDGAFGIAIDPTRMPKTLVAYDRGGRVVTTLDISERWARRPAL